MLRRFLIVLSTLLALPVIAQDSVGVVVVEEPGRGLFFWLAILAVVAGVFLGGRWLWRKYNAEVDESYPQQRSP